MTEPRLIYIPPQKYKEDCLKTTRMFFDSGFDPQFTVALYRGGAVSGCYITDALRRFRTNRLHLSPEEMEKYYNEVLRMSSYDKISQGAQQRTIRISGAIEHIVEGIKHRRLKTGSVTDDVFDTGLSIDAILQIFEKGLEVKNAVSSEPRNSGSARLYTFIFDSGRVQYPVDIPLHGDVEPLDKDCDVRIAMPYAKSYANATTRELPKAVAEVYDRCADGSDIWLNIAHETSDLDDPHLRAFDRRTAAILLDGSTPTTTFVDMKKALQRSKRVERLVEKIREATRE